MTTNFELFFIRIKEAADCTSDKELAEFFNMNKSTLSMWKSREKVDYDLLFTKFEHINYNWLFKGVGTKEMPNSSEKELTITEVYKELSDKFENLNCEIDLLKAGYKLQRNSES